ncbi:hypothetical protein SAMN05444354_13645 [Stigmatella aurantiaca]|uniref:Lipoprotein n=1 Tax=Stigmatella aurantiaca TaxID=41 RepID=A0A1H8F987_STIAU|nr:MULTISPECIES: hypothetical protein [Stigmatella]SEN28292.1 hypothetical protein SAMN05444354_13645 [Stigmatella aurantiaca]
MKLPLMAALAALTLYGCASQSSNTREASASEAGAVGGSGNVDSSTGSSSGEASASEASSEESLTPGEASNVTTLEERDRKDAPTVYEGEATGGSGSGSETVTTDDGQKWDVQQNNGQDLGTNQSAPEGAVNQNNGGTGGSGSESGSGKSEVIEDPTINKSDVSIPTTDSTNK